MNLTYGLKFHNAQLVLELDISEPADKKIAGKILKGEPVISSQHFIAGGETDEAAVIILNGNDLIQSIVGTWDLHHSIQNKISYTNYSKFTHKYEVCAFFLEPIDSITNEYYLYFTFDNYKKL